ncbi:uncharacterized protein [Bombus fervidus]|uniref:uncharacterized protein n=1 Tax=Bombus fervidus TaxID=203811 RepID=UPI003D187A04
MLAEAFPSGVPIQTSLVPRKRDSEEPMGDSRRPIKRMRRCDEPPVPEWSEELFDIDAEAVDFPSELSFDNFVTVDESFFDAETVVLEWEPPLVEVVDTDRCVKVHLQTKFPERFWRHMFVTMLLGEREFPLLCVIGICVSSANFVLELLASILIWCSCFNFAGSLFDNRGFLIIFLVVFCCFFFVQYIYTF